MMNYINFLIDNPTITLIHLIVLSLCVGSFLNVVIHRLPIMLNKEWTALSKEFLNLESSETERETYNLLTPKSKCPNCNTAIKPWHNIPVLGYLWLKGKCANCKISFSIRYPLVEAATALISVSVFYKFGVSLECMAALLFCWILIALTMIDFDTQLLPDSMTIPLIWIGLMINAYNTFIPLQDAVFSAVGAYVFLWSFVYLFKLFTGKDGMGEGDFKLFAAFGAWFGWQSLPLILVFSSFVGAIIGIIFLKLSKLNSDTPIAFGPYLCIAAYLYLLYGKEFLNWYLGYL